jgi:hypothetical protein
MTYAANYRDFGSYFRDMDSTKSSPDANKPGILRRIFGAIFETRQEQIEREIARFVARSGGRITDDIERKIMQHFFTCRDVRYRPEADSCTAAKRPLAVWE